MHICIRKKIEKIDALMKTPQMSRHLDKCLCHHYLAIWQHV